MSENTGFGPTPESNTRLSCFIDEDPFCDALQECVAMYEHVRNSEKQVPLEMVENLRQSLAEAGSGKALDAVKLMEVHNKLSDMIKPAKPYSIAYIYEQKGRRRKLKFLGPIAIIRRMVVVSIFSLILFVVASAIAPADENAFAAAGTRLFYAQHAFTALVLMSAAAVGACFSNLFRAYKYVSTNLFDPKQDMTYWIRLILGITAGYLLAEVIPLDLGQNKLEKPLLAILGGFSASAVHAILERLVQAVESIVRGDATAMVQSREAEISARLEREATQHRVGLAKEIMEARAKLKATGDTSAIDADLDKLIKNALSST